MAGMLPSKKPVSLMIATSAASRSRFASSQRVEVDGARLLLALEHVAHVDRHRATRREEARGGHHVGVDLALVVGRAAREDPVADDDRLERRRRPQVERVDRLDVVVAVDDDRRGVRRVEPVGVDDRVAAGLADLDVLEAGRGQGVGQPAPRRRGSRRRGPGWPRRSGSGGTPCTTRAGRPWSRRDGRRGRRQGRRSGSASGNRSGAHRAGNSIERAVVGPARRCWVWVGRRWPPPIRPAAGSARGRAGRGR